MAFRTKTETKTFTKETKTITSITCDYCGKEIPYKKYGGGFNVFDVMGYNEYASGYGVKNCCSLNCACKLIEQMEADRGDSIEEYDILKEHYQLGEEV